MKQEKYLLVETAKYLAENPSITGTKFMNDFFEKFATESNIQQCHQKSFSYRKKLFGPAVEANPKKIQVSLLVGLSSLLNKVKLLPDKDLIILE